MSKLVIKILGICLIVSVAGGCASTQTESKPVTYHTKGEVTYQEANIKPPEGYTPPETTQLTFVGNNGEGYFDPTGKKIIFQSKQRPSHSNTHIYILDLNTKAEKQITFGSSEHTCSYFDPRNPNQIIYSSTSDEELEHPELKKDQGGFAIEYASKKRKYEWKFLPFEIYKHNLKTKSVDRLTHSVGYDAEATFNSIGSKIIYTSIRDGDLELYMMDRDGLNQRRMTSIEGYDGGAFFSPDNAHLIWRGFHLPDGTCHLFRSDEKGENIKQLTPDKGIHWCPSWHPSGKWVIYSSNRAGIGNFELYITDKEGSCHKRLTYSPRSDILPVFSPDGKKILFTSDRKSDRDIFTADGSTKLLKFKGKSGKTLFYSPKAKKKIPVKVDTLKTKLVVSILGQELVVKLPKAPNKKSKMPYKPGTKKYFDINGNQLKVVKESKYGNNYISFAGQKVWVQVAFSDDGNFYLLDPHQKLFSADDPKTGPYYSPDGKKVLTHTDRRDQTKFVDASGKNQLALGKLTKQSQLYLMDFVMPETSCLDLKTHSLKVKL
jgi:TolB protein